MRLNNCTRAEALVQFSPRQIVRINRLTRYVFLQMATCSCYSSLLSRRRYRRSQPQETCIDLYGPTSEWGLGEGKGCVTDSNQLPERDRVQCFFLKNDPDKKKLFPFIMTCIPRRYMSERLYLTTTSDIVLFNKLRESKVSYLE